MAEFFNWLHNNEFNFSVSAFYDGGFTVTLGDELNGKKFEAQTYDFAQVPRILLAFCKKQCPNFDWVAAQKRHNWQI